MTYQIHLFNSSDERVAIIQDEILLSASVDLTIDGAPTLTFSIPQNDDKATYVSPLYYAKVWNTESAAYEFSIFKLVDPEIVDDGSNLVIKAEYQGILTQLKYEYVDTYDTGSSGDTFTNVVTALLALQVNSPAITVGTIEPSDTVAIAVESGDIYGALNNIRDAYGGWFEVDASRELNWYEDNINDPDREIRRKKNLKAITYTPGYSEIVNRVYAYGKGESTARVNLTDAGEAHEYIEDVTSQSTYGVQARKYIDKSITHPATLLKFAQRILAEYKNPPYQYSVDLVNLADVDGYTYSLESLALDTRVRIIDDLISVDVDTSIVEMSINLLAPEEIEIELSTVKKDISDLFGDVKSAQDLTNSIATQIGAGQVTVLGTFTVIDWASDGVTTIDGGNITANTITAEKVNFAVADSSNIVATINASSEGIQISGALIEITGSTTFASGYDPTDKVENVGGSYVSAASGPRVKIFPDVNVGIQVMDGSANNVFMCYVGGTDVGDVIIGDYAGGSGAKWDNSASTFDIKGTLTACSIGSGGSLSVVGDIQSNDYVSASAGWKISGTTAEFNDVTIRGNLDACTVGSGKTLTVNGNISLSGSSPYVDVYYDDSGTVYHAKVQAGKFTCELGAGTVYGQWYGGSIDLLGHVRIRSGTITGTTVLDIQPGGHISMSGNITCTGDITCDDITCDDLTVDAIKSASGKIEIENSILFTSSSYGIHFNNDGTNTVLYSNGTHLYFRDSGGTIHTLV